MRLMDQMTPDWGHHRKKDDWDYWSRGKMLEPHMTLVDY